MKRFSTILLSAVLLSTLFATAQAPQMPKPGAELKNLNFYLGSWKETGDMKPGAMGPGGKFAGTNRGEWMQGGFYLVVHSQGTSPTGKESALSIYGYDTDKKVYTYDEFNSSGSPIHATGTFDGKVWTWTGDMVMGGQPIKSHFILTETSATSYEFKLEMSQDGTNFATVMDGKGTKAAGAAAKK
jgi:hypothetical protein